MLKDAYSATNERQSLSGIERYFDDDELIVIKTDNRGIITYANDVFIRLSGYEERDLLGKPHSIIRHPHMPRCVFKLLWDALKAGHEIFAYVVNRSRNGDHYWVLAHVTPTLDPLGHVSGFHSSRRVPRREAVSTVEVLYAKLVEIEQSQPDSRKALEASTEFLTALLNEKGVSYDEFILSL